MKKAAVWIVDHPKSCVICLILIVLLLSVKITQVKINSDLTQLIPKDDPRTKYYEDFFKGAFSSDILSVVVVKPEIGDVFNHETLSLIQNMTDDLFGIDGVITVNSLTTVQKIKGEDGFLNTDQLIEEVPTDPEELLKIKESALSNDHFIGYIVSEDGRAAGINIYTEEPAGDQTFDKRFVEKVSAIIEKYEKGHQIYHVGSPLATYTFLQYIELDQRTINGAMIIFFLGFLILCYRSYLSVLLPMVTTGLSVIATLGFMALMNYPITPETALVPGLLLVIGSTEDMHILSMYFLQLRKGLGKKEAVKHAMEHSALPITLTSFTTIIGFSTLAFNDTTMIKEFGIVMAFGLLVNYLVTVLTVPGILQFLKIPKNYGQHRDPEKRGLLSLNLVLEKIINVNKHRQSTVTIVTLIVVVLAIIGLLQVRVNNNFMSFFKASAPFRKDVERLHKDLTGFSTMSIVVETEGMGDVIEPDVLKQIDEFQEYLKMMGKYDKVVSIVDYVKVMNREMNGGRKELESIPDTRPAIAQYMMLMDYDTLSQYLDADRRNARILLIHKMASSYEFNKAVQQVKDYLDENLKGYVKGDGVQNITVTLTGLDFLIKNSVDTLVRGQVQGLGIALAVIFVLMSLLFMSAKGGLVAIISNSIPILINFGIMGWFAIELNTSTSMVALIALGIAIDDTIHFMVRFQNELRATNDQKTAMANAIQAEGEPVIFTSVALSVGFAILMLSNFVPSAYFGFLAALVMVYALLTDLFVNPILLLTVQLITVWDYVALKFKRAVLQESIVLKNLKYSEAKKIILLGSIRKASAGEHIFHQGDKGEEMYLILSGGVKIFAECEGETKLLNTLEAGELFGEMALLGEGVRTASVHAETDVELLRIDYNALERVRRRNPKISAKLYMNIARILSDRVKAMNIEQLKAAAG